MATAWTARTGIPCSAVSKGQAMREKVSNKGSQAGREVVGKLIFEWRGSISVSLNVIHVNTVCVAYVTAIMCRSEEYWEISQVS